MTFDLADYRRGAGALAAPSLNLMAVDAVESSGENFWLLGNKHVPPVRFEAHIFDARTGGRFRASHPHLSSPSWNPALAARSKAGAWAQLEEAMALDKRAAMESTSWGPFQIMGYHATALGYPSVEAMVDDVDGPDDDGQMDMFVRFVRADRRLLNAIREGDWETWERVYNGGGYGGAYAAKIRNWIATHAANDGSLPITVPRVLRKGYRGQDVAALQKALNIPTDGVFGQHTEDAVRTFQACIKGLVDDGIVGVMTLRALGLAV
jgi:hypothetical protein